MILPILFDLSSYVILFHSEETLIKFVIKGVFAVSIISLFSIKRKKGLVGDITTVKVREQKAETNNRLYKTCLLLLDLLSNNHVRK